MSFKIYHNYQINSKTNTTTYMHYVTCLRHLKKKNKYNIITAYLDTKELFRVLCQLFLRYFIRSTFTKGLHYFAKI